MPRAAATETRAEPRRSSRIKALPKLDPPKRAPPEPRVKKVAPHAEGKPADDEPPAPKHKSSRGRKRTTEEVNGPEEEAEKPPSKKAKSKAKPALKPAPASKAAAAGTLKPGSHGASAKTPSTFTAKNPAGSKKPASKVGDVNASDRHIVAVQETIAEEPPAEAADEAERT